ncbi:BZ3500_MvSof-1268-A1-R1_Chr3-2g06307 [Microbotryum saponariae]|uniref:BZ3500_MvSof-1268-A1-R1_Chr3-2g06307 protein n=1 Tax=Microbotryum saponariae TaxID=289078 RepID=A0A2X0MVA8_9BASI|nr:BZ3500_MvSof-1268-A1-R1_Chr3-2g06307 [Microbotryum saponariae]SDA04278.1 BZ3501_MvSof-1269-A2-R1_Chr3-2g05998 [Microbotryum saponariae]
MQLKNFFLLATVVVGVSAQAVSSRGDVQIERSDNNAEGKIEGFEVVRRSVITNTPCHFLVRLPGKRGPGFAGVGIHHHAPGYQACWDGCQKIKCKQG